MDTVIWQSILLLISRYEENGRDTVQIETSIYHLLFPAIKVEIHLGKKPEKMTWENDLHKQSAIARYHDSQSWRLCHGKFLGCVVIVLSLNTGAGISSNDIAIVWIAKHTKKNTCLG